MFVEMQQSKNARPKYRKSTFSRAIEFDFYLFRAPQMPVIVDDVAPALLVIIQLGVPRVATGGRAFSFQIVAIHTDALAALRVRAKRSVAQGRAADSRRYATQRAILVHNLPMAFPVIVNARVLVVAVIVFAASFQFIAVALDVLTRLRVWRSNHSNRPTITARICRRGAVHAVQLAVFIRHVAVAFLVIIELGIVPVSICRLAAGFQVITTHVDVLAGLCVRTVGHARLVTGPISRYRRGSVCGAAQRAIVIHDVAAAALKIAQLCGFPFPVCVLAVRREHSVAHIQIFTALLVRS